MNEKNYQLEILRVISCILVIVIHVSNCYSRAFLETSNINYVVSVLFNIVARVSVPVFFMLSGATMLRGQYGMKKYIKKVVKMFAVIVCWSIFYYIWNKVYMDRDYSFRDILETPVKLHLWYLYAYIGVLLVLPFLQSAFSKLEKKYELLFVVLWLGTMLVYRLASFYGYEITYDMPIMGTTYYVGYFVMGHLIYKYLSDIKIKDWALRCIMCASVACSFGLTCYYSFTKMTHYTWFLHYKDLFIILSSLAFFIYIARKQSRIVLIHQKNPIKMISKASFMIYLVHPLFLDIIKTNIPLTTLPAILMIPLLALMILICSMATAYVIRKLSEGLFKIPGVSNINQKVKKS